MKAVIEIGGRQHLVEKGDELTVNRVIDQKKLELEPLLVFDNDKIEVGKPTVEGGKVTAEVVETVKGPKTTSIRYKAKKRVKKIRGQRQDVTKIVIQNITLSSKK